MLCQLIPALDKFCFINFCCFLKYFLVVGIKSNLLHGTRNLQLNYTPNPFSFWVFHLKLRKSCDFFFHTLMTYWNCCSVDKAFSGYCFISIYFFFIYLTYKEQFPLSPLLLLPFSNSHLPSHLPAPPSNPPPSSCWFTAHVLPGAQVSYLCRFLHHDLDPAPCSYKPSSISSGGLLEFAQCLAVDH